MGERVCLQMQVTVKQPGDLQDGFLVLLGGKFSPVGGPFQEQLPLSGDVEMSLLQFYCFDFVLCFLLCS